MDGLKIHNITFLCFVLCLANREMYDPAQLELDGNVQSISDSIEGSLPEKAATWQESLECAERFNPHPRNPKRFWRDPRRGKGPLCVILLVRLLLIDPKRVIYL